MRRFKAAILGLTHPHSAALIEALASLPEIAEILAWDPSRAVKAPVATKVVAFTGDLAALLAHPDLDFVLNCGRTDQAAAWTRLALKAGRHVLTEKPAGISVREIAALVRLARIQDRHVSILYANRVHPVASAIRRLCQDGVIGELISVEVRLLTTQVRFRSPKSWLFQRKRAGGGILTWLGCHHLDLLQYLTGDDIVRVGACLARRSGEKIDVEDIAALAFRLRSGAVGTFHAGYVLAFSGGGYMNPQGNDAYLALHGQRGRIVWPSQQALRLVIESPGRKPVREIIFPAPKHTMGHQTRRAHLRAFLRCLEGRAPCPAPLEAGLRTAQVIAAAERSSRSGRFAEV